MVGLLMVLVVVLVVALVMVLVVVLVLVPVMVLVVVMMLLVCGAGGGARDWQRFLSSAVKGAPSCLCLGWTPKPQKDTLTARPP